MERQFKIRTRVDVITNSSDESFIVIRSGNADKVKAVWEDYMKKNGLDIDKWGCGCLFPDTYNQLGEDAVRIDWAIMCNLDDAFGSLIDCFGKENVKRD